MGEQKVLFSGDEGAQFSPCRKWRYALWRTWQEGEGHAMFIGLNPSTADERTNDPTVRRCMEFARRWGYGGIYMLNLYAWRSTYPKMLLQVDDPVGQQNDEFISMYAKSASVVVAAWGAFTFAHRRGELISGLLNEYLYCLGTTKSGAPRHPLYVPYRNMISRWKGYTCLNG